MDKQHIIEEIRRTSEANGGVPLGRQRFFQETGIKESDWFGKFWVRWSDAVSEAGFVPNKKNEAYDEQWLIEKYICLIRELGRLPVAGELRIKAREDSEFPSHNVFGRIGSNKNQLIARISEYCRDRNGYEDIFDICENSLKTNDQPICGNRNEEADDPLGFVYLLKSGRFYKIGRSNSIGRREREITLQLPEKAEIIHSIGTDDPIGIEAYWHKRFQSKRKNGEWFELNTFDVKAFKRRKFM